ncbi:endonuclease domain-containing protein [Salinarimonas sp.]|uniref:endonuclease domain-containing protein n=1 Tax=Salinarimonas sp. TaxID=2766526 RepID=UPI0032D8F8A8
MTVRARGRPTTSVAPTRVRALRLYPTPMEKRLWGGLRKLRPAGYHFRRQVPIGPFVVDFACLKARLVVEVDGAHHGEPGHEGRDRSRDRMLRAEGFRVARFWNRQIALELPYVMDEIHARLTDPERYWS